MTDTFTARPDLGQHLATVASVLRDMAGGNHWQVPGIRAEIAKAKHLAPPEQLAHAVIAWCTTRLDLRAPIGLAEDGPHWRTGRTPDTRVKPAKCTEHPTENASGCRSCAADRKGLPENRTDTLALSPTQAALNERGAAVVAAALKDAMRTNERKRDDDE